MFRKLMAGEDIKTVKANPSVLKLLKRDRALELYANREVRAWITEEREGEVEVLAFTRRSDSRFYSHE